MLKPAAPEPGGTDPAEERPIGELVHQLVEDGKAYAAAELNVAKATALAKVDAVKLPAILLAAAFLFLQAGVVVLGMTVYLTLVSRLGPFASGMIATLLMLGIAGGLAWYAAKRLREDL
jgi:hypothetical protein